MRRGWGTVVLLALCALCGRGEGPAQALDAPLVRLEAKTLGDPRFDILFEELDRTANTSTIRVIHRQGGPTGSTMFVTRGMYLVGKTRQAEYFVPLKEWRDADGNGMYLVGFTNDKEADAGATFGPEYAGKERLSVSRFAAIFEKPSPDPAAPAPAPAPRQAERDALLTQFRVAAAAYRQEFGQLPPGDNLAFHRAMSGDNPRKIVFMEFEGKSIGAGGELVDSWGTPYRMSVADGKTLTIASAGPDKAFGTSDDLAVSVP